MLKKRFPEHQCNAAAKKRNAESNSVTNFYFLTCLWYSFFHVIWTCMELSKIICGEI